ncbi:MAG: BLUF domain-containing protein [Planctomycetota bacterium]
MHRLVYSCHATREMSQADLKQIADASQRRNTRLSVTGVLLYGHRRFVQVLEGEAPGVMEVLEQIDNDDRVSPMRVEALLRIDRPLFDRWSMAVSDVTSNAAVASGHFAELLTIFATQPDQTRSREDVERVLASYRELLDQHQTEMITA